MSAMVAEVVKGQVESVAAARVPLVVSATVVEVVKDRVGSVAVAMAAVAIRAAAWVAEVMVVLTAEVRAVR